MRTVCDGSVVGPELLAVDEVVAVELVAVRRVALHRGLELVLVLRVVVAFGELRDGRLLDVVGVHHLAQAVAYAGQAGADAPWGPHPGGPRTPGQPRGAGRGPAAGGEP